MKRIKPPSTGLNCRGRRPACASSWRTSWFQWHPFAGRRHGSVGRVLVQGERQKRRPGVLHEQGAAALAQHPGRLCQRPLGPAKHAQAERVQHAVKAASLEWQLLGVACSTTLLSTVPCACS